MNQEVIVSLIIPIYNEEPILLDSLHEILKFMEGRCDYSWELILVNDGSTDNSGRILEELNSKRENVVVVHHRVNKNLGEALKTGFAASKGKYVVTYDLDLSYHVGHISDIVDKLLYSDADVVIASPYMEGGKTTAVPYNRLLYSRILNFFMAKASQANLKTFTGMVRGYKGSFIRSINLKASDFEINPEIIYKAFILRAHIVEIPAHLDWSFQNKKAGRVSGMRIARGILSGLMACFIFRPYVFFITAGILFLIAAFYMLSWIGFHTFQVYPDIITDSTYFDDKFSMAISEVFKHRPQSFLIAGFVLIAAFQFIGMGFLSLQKKRYFEEGFHINTTILREMKMKNTGYTTSSQTGNNTFAPPSYKRSVDPETIDA